ncbi:MAG: fumarylacetoacetate hydrolase family protein [Synergistaceae bacterium]|jgi:2-keto-4-pentenoate hydratase/2-oxohepta-3-ene-1,7-dioic acid hydratase in catechol pathway|nr:fumarylacetoacetate hydrolase family protein [Synergistaceae bacterium]
MERCGEEGAAAELMGLEEGTRLVRFLQDGEVRCGRLVGEEVELGLSPAGRKYGVEGLKFLTPVVPGTIWCIGLNYREHARESNMAIPDEPCVFMKPRTCLIAQGDPIRLPSWAGRVDYEGELAVVIGRTCKNVDEAGASDCVLGYSCFNDVSARVLQHRDGQWIRAKGFDTFGPFGPALLVTRKMPEAAKLTTRLNGNVVQRGHFGDMIFSVPAIVAHLSRFATLQPGDVIATGTPSGVGPVSVGDVVEIDIEGIGVLKNPVAGE